MSANGVVWQDPPESGGRRGAWLERLSPLMAEPGRWALVHSTPTTSTAGSTVHALRQGAMRVPEGRWEFTIRKKDIYARYLGPEDGEVS